MEYINNLSGVNDYSAFLQRQMGNRYKNWLATFEETQEIFDKNRFSLMIGYMEEEEQNRLVISSAAQLLFIRFNDIKSLTDTLSMLYTAPKIYAVLDDLTAVIDAIVDEFMNDRKINNVEIKNQIIELIKTKNELRIIDGKGYAKIKVKDQIYLIDKVGNVYFKTIKNANKIAEGNIDMTPYVDNGILTIYVSDGTIQKYKLADIDYNLWNQHLVNKEKNLETSLNNLLCKEINNTKTLNTPYIREDVREKVIAGTEFREYMEQEQTILKRPYIKKEIVAMVIDRDIRNNHDNMKEQNRIFFEEENLEDEFEQSMSM